MNLRELLFRASLATLLSFASFAPAKGTQKPNIVIILADDQGWGDLSIHGNMNLHTPNIDSLARGGARFERFYVCAVCAPTRAEFLTGRYHPRGGVRGVSAGQERLNLDEKTVAEAFKAAGYVTGAFGKWHNGSQWPYHPNSRGFDEYYGFTSGHWGEYSDPPLEHTGRLIRGKGYIADIFTDRAIEFIETNKTKPFFCYLPYNIPHSPWAVPEKFWARFKDKPINMRGAAGDKENVDVTRCALAMCENLDWNVGRVLQKLDELKLTDKTIVIYFSDNGPNSVRWNGGMKGIKGSVDEGGVRSPFFIRWPAKIKPGTTVREIAGAIDLLPTLTTLAKVSRIGNKPLDGKDLSPLLLGRDGMLPSQRLQGQRNTVPPWPARMIFSHQNGNVSVRTQRYRLDPAGALFDMVADPGQTKDIASEKPDIAEKLSRAVVDWQQEVWGKTDSTAGAGKMNRSKRDVDDRPFSVGYPEFRMTPLPARDGVPHGDVRRSASALNCSYFVNWTSKEDSMTWDIEVHTTGDYEVAIYYTAPEAGSIIELTFHDSRLTGKVAPAWNPPLYTNQDTLPRPHGESQMKEFRPLNLGKTHLKKGRGLLTLRAKEIVNQNVMDVRLITLTLLKK